jgi:hypothetical protein
MPPISTAKVELLSKLTFPELRMPGLVPGATVPPLTVTVLALLMEPVRQSASCVYRRVAGDSEPLTFSRPPLIAVNAP